MPTTTKISRNDLQRVLDAASGGELGVTFNDDESVTISDARLGGVAMTVERPALGIELPAPAIDVEALSGFEAAIPVAPPAAEDPAPVETPPTDPAAPTPVVEVPAPAPGPVVPEVTEDVAPAIDAPPPAQPVAAPAPAPEVAQPAPDAPAADLGPQADPAQ